MWGSQRKGKQRTPSVLRGDSSESHSPPPHTHTSRACGSSPFLLPSEACALPPFSPPESSPPWGPLSLLVFSCRRDVICKEQHLAFEGDPLSHPSVPASALSSRWKDTPVALTSPTRPTCSHLSSTCVPHSSHPPPPPGSVCFPSQSVSCAHHC